MHFAPNERLTCNPSVCLCAEASSERSAEPPAVRVTTSASAAVLRHLADVPWLAKNVVWLVPSAHCQALQAAEVRPRQCTPSVVEPA